MPLYRIPDRGVAVPRVGLRPQPGSDAMDCFRTRIWRIGIAAILIRLAPLSGLAEVIG
jgi:hypothetical protein